MFIGVVLVKVSLRLLYLFLWVLLRVLLSVLIWFCCCLGFANALICVH